MRRSLLSEQDPKAFDESYSSACFVIGRYHPVSPSALQLQSSGAAPIVSSADVRSNNYQLICVVNRRQLDLPEQCAIGWKQLTVIVS